MTSYAVTYRSGTEVAACNPAAVDSSLPVPFSRQGNFRAFVQSKTGNLVACVSTEGLTVTDLTSNTEIYSFQQKGIIEVSMSPKGTYVCTWERQAKPDPATNRPHMNLLIHNVLTKEVIARHPHKNQASWIPQWSDDESLYGRLSGTSDVTFYVTIGPNAGAAFKLRGATNIADYSISPGNNPHVVVFIPEDKRGTPAIVKMFSLGNFQNPTSAKTFYKADKVKFVWNHLGTGVLVLTSTEVDSTGQSYYGENNLYYMSTAGNWDCRVALDKEGPIHDLAWAPNGREFAVIYGFMPSKTMMFNYKADPVFDFGTAARNTLAFSPNGRILLIGGFGNLPGEFELWDLSKTLKLANLSSPNATQITWSPDGRHLLTATLSPRLRVDNGWKVWHYRGVCVAKHDVKELFQIEWRPVSSAGPNIEQWARRELSPAPAGIQGVGAAKPKSVGGAYRPPSARMGGAARSVPGAAFVETSGGNKSPGLRGGPRQVPGMTPPPGANANGNVGARGGSAASANGNGGRNSPRPGQQLRAQGGASSPMSAGQPPRSGTSSPAAPPSPAGSAGGGGGAGEPGAEKRIQTLTKKLKQIQGLKQKMSNGERLDQAQQKKVASEGDVRTELALLGVTQLSI
ncbi:eukaryotic translation initiation factor eIF2A-domain-containing protein [Catenaria anguillulae PL171]|uniref:Eukaryotic translation initiation factor 2A n=1 Tax=Catenaria anguillulae PL171 TaxID=765915 RepID=A0A1Y2HJ42_9FUNG|nr:eukaryotic translation initiation factor eIF2A-domain-containing protein [Catenaria anguillulae PL171]